MSGETKQRISELEAEIARLKEAQPTLRDQFAMAAITAAYKMDRRGWSKDDPDCAENIAIGAYEIADAMMEARDAK